MKKNIFKICLSLTLVVSVYSCKKCQTCKCWKDGVMTEEHECGRSTNHNDYFRTWQNNLETKYDYCECYSD